MLIERLSEIIGKRKLSGENRLIIKKAFRDIWPKFAQCRKQQKFQWETFELGNVGKNRSPRDSNPRTPVSPATYANCRRREQSVLKKWIFQESSVIWWNQYKAVVPVIVGYIFLQSPPTKNLWALGGQVKQSFILVNALMVNCFDSDEITPIFHLFYINQV